MQSFVKKIQAHYQINAALDKDEIGRQAEALIADVVKKFKPERVGLSFVADIDFGDYDTIAVKLSLQPHQDADWFSWPKYLELMQNGTIKKYPDFKSYMEKLDKKLRKLADQLEQLDESVDKDIEITLP